MRCCATRPGGFSSRCFAMGFSTPICIPAICSSMRKARSRWSISASWVGSTARPAITWPTCCWAFCRAITAVSRKCISTPAMCRAAARSTPSPRPAARWGEPILGRPLNEISIARLLAQLFHVTEEFEMETQPQLLLLQKTMVLVEGVGRRLDPNVNIWSLSRPLVEAWMRDNRGPEARLRQRIDSLVEALDQVPRLLRNLDKLIGDWAQEGVILHAESLATQAAHRGRLLPLLVIPLWIAPAALVAIAAMLLAR